MRKGWLRWRRLFLVYDWVNGCQLPVAGTFKVLGFKFQVTGYQLPVTSYRLPVTGLRWLVQMITPSFISSLRSAMLANSMLCVTITKV